MNSLIGHIRKEEPKPPSLTAVARGTERNIQPNLFQDYLPQSNLSFLVTGLQKMPAEQTRITIQAIDASHMQSRDEHFVSLS
jgi:hypothetical protein